MFSIMRLNVKQFTYCLQNKYVIVKFYAFYAENLFIQPNINIRDIGQIVHNYKRVVKRVREHEYKRVRVKVTLQQYLVLIIV